MPQFFGLFRLVTTDAKFERNWVSGQNLEVTTNAGEETGFLYVSPIDLDQRQPDRFIRELCHRAW